MPLNNIEKNLNLKRKKNLNLELTIFYINKPKEDRTCCGLNKNTYPIINNHGQRGMLSEIWLMNCICLSVHHKRRCSY